jgi:hypothetical protein
MSGGGGYAHSDPSYGQGMNQSTGVGFSAPQGGVSRWRLGGARFGIVPTFSRFEHRGY